MFNRKLNQRLFDPSRRIERTKRLIETSAVIGRTIREVIEPVLKPDPANEAPDESVVEGSFRVVEPDAPAGEQEIEVTILTRPGPDQNKQRPATTQLIIPPLPADYKEETSPGETASASTAEAETTFPFRFPEQFQEWLDKIPIPQVAPAPERTDEEKTKPAEKEAADPRFISGAYSSEVGSRAYKLYVPSGYTGQPLPLVVMLHGCTQSPDSFAISTRMNESAEEHTFFVLYPAQTFKANLAKCWNWFKESEQQRDQGEPGIIAGMTREIINSYGLDSRRVYVAGISAGGAMAMVMGMTYPDLYAATGIQSGVPYGVAHNIPTGLAVIKGGGAISGERLMSAPGGKAKPRVVPTIVFHGDQDSIVYPRNCDQIVAQWLEIDKKQGKNGSTPRITVHPGQVPDGHAYTRSVYHDLNGGTLMEQWLVHGAGHAWSGGNPDVAWTDAKGPNATQEMLRFFFEHPHPAA